MRKIWQFIFTVLLILTGFPIQSLSIEKSGLIKTPAELTNYKEYTQNEAISSFLSLVAARSKELQILTVGRSLPVSNYPARDIYLAVLTDEGVSRPLDLNRGKLTVFVIASQHGNEQSAKEAALWLLRDLAMGELKPLLKKVNVLIIPQANPFGNYFNVRVNETQLDLNRDHIKLEGEGTRAIHRVFRAWWPEVTIDVHEKGDDYYRVSIGCVSNLNISQEIQTYSRQVILSEVEEKLKKRNITFHEYLVTEELGIDTSSGAMVRREGGPREMMMRFSTTDLNDGRNSLGIFETLSFIQEGASRHDLETLEARTRWQYYGLRAFLESVAGNSQAIQKKIRTLRQQLLERASKVDERNVIHLRMEYARDPNQPELVLKQFERVENPIRGVLKVDKKAGELLMADEIEPYLAPGQQKIITQVVKNWFPAVESRLAVSRPLGYLIPAKHIDVVENLLALGVEVRVLSRDENVEVEAFKIVEIVPSNLDYVAPAKISLEKESMPVLIRKGDYYVSCQQPAANLIPALLEPQSQYGFIRYWKYKLVPEAGNYYAFYRINKKPPANTVAYKAWTLMN